VTLAPIVQVADKDAIVTAGDDLLCSEALTLWRLVDLRGPRAPGGFRVSFESRYPPEKVVTEDPWDSAARVRYGPFSIGRRIYPLGLGNKVARNAPGNAIKLHGAENGTRH
jgi:hypothetical protein